MSRPRLLRRARLATASKPICSALTTAAAELHLNANWMLTGRFASDFGPTAQTYAGTGTLRYSW